MRKKFFEGVKEFAKAHALLSVFAALSAILSAAVYFGTFKMTYNRLVHTLSALPALLGILACLPIAAYVVSMLFVRRKWALVATLSAGLILSAEHFLFTLYILSKLLYFLIEGAPYLVIAAAVLVAASAVLIAKKAGKVGKIATVSVLAAAVFFTFIFGVFDLKPMYFSSGAVVFAVGDEYQIAWSTSVSSTGAVRIGDRVFKDGSAGILRTSTLHKVSVPRALLDEVGAYGVESEAVFSNRAYLSSTGKTVSKTYAFRPVDLSDGLQLYDFSDSHLLARGATAAASYWGDALDVLVANGDLFNDVSREFQVAMVFKMLANMTSSSRPVVFTRGNHESIGSMLADFPDYFASRDGKYYYTVRFGNIMFLALDVATEKDDDDKLVKPLADFDSYRREELAWLETLPNAAELKGQGIDHVIALSHIAYPRYINEYHREFIAALIDETKRIGVELLMSGHSHKIRFYPTDDETNVASYPVAICSIRANDSFEYETCSATQFTGAALLFGEGERKIMFTNALHEVKAVCEF